MTSLDDGLLRSVAAVVIIAASVLGTPILGYLAVVGLGAWAYNEIGPIAGQIVAGGSGLAAVTGAVLGTRLLLLRI